MRITVVALLALLGIAAAPRLSWREGKPMPRAKAGAATALLGDRLVLAGGTYWESGQKHWISEVDAYDMAKDEWRSGPPLPFPLSYGACVRSERGLELLGGWDGARLHKQCLTLDEGMTKWIPSGTLPEGRVF